MSLSNQVMGAKPVATAAPATAAPKAETTQNGDHEAFRLSGESIRKSKSADEKALEGSKSGAIAFVACLGDPNKPQPRRDGKEDVDSFVVVGYRFKAIEAVSVPKANLKSGFKSLMDVEDMTEVAIKKGQTFDLNIFEAGVLISRPEYSGRFTGEDKEVSLTIKFSKTRKEPLPVLKLDGKGSIKLGMILVADMVPTAGNPKGTPKVKDEFAEKFAVLYIRKSAGSRSAAKVAQKGESQADLAAAFNAYVQSR